MSAKDLKALVRRLFEESNKGKAAFMTAIDELGTTDLVFHNSIGEDIHGIKDYKESEGKVFDAFSDLHFTLDDMIVEGDRAAVRFTLSALHKGELMGIPPTNKKVTLSVIIIVRIVNGKFVEEWERYDTLGLMRQLCLVPTPGYHKP